ncbi:hypothetical protein DRO34_06760, partial [Candidatus Bathyarchaeota archaeon]
MLERVLKKRWVVKAVCIFLTITCFVQFTSLVNIAYALKEKQNTLTLKRHFLKEPPPITLKERSALARQLLEGKQHQPGATKELIHCLKSIREILERIEQKNKVGEDTSIEQKILFAKYASLKDLDKKVRKNFEIDIAKLEGITEAKAEVVSTAINRLEDARKRYNEPIKPILSKLKRITEDEKLSIERIRNLKEYLNKSVVLEVKRPVLKPAPPSFRPSNFKPLPPNTKGKVKPAYILQKTSTSSSGKLQSKVYASDKTEAGASVPSASLSPAPEDLEETIDVVITQEMRDLVASLNNSPARIFEWVKNNIHVEFYYGSLKGSVGTFMEKAGNDTDTCSLLLALFRAANIPSRYVAGTIEIPIDKAKSITGVNDPQSVGDLIASAGIPGVLIVSGEEIIALRMEYTWIEAFVDYDPYAGAKAGEGTLWVPLAPGYKLYDYDEGLDLVQMSGFDTEVFLDDFISELKTESPVELYKAYFEDYLKENNPGHNWQDGLRTRQLRNERFRTLPNTLNFDVISINAEYAELPDDLRHKVTISVSEVGLSHTLNLCEVIGKKVTYSYPPADEVSKNLIDSSGGIENVHPLAVNLLPSIKVEGETVATGSVVNAGYYHTLRTTFTVPLQSPDFVEYLVISGAYYAIGLDPQFVSNKFLVDRIAQYISTIGDTLENTDNMDQITGEALYLAVMKYFNDCNTGDNIFAQTLKVVFLKQTSDSITGENLVVYYLFGVPDDLEPGGYFVDAKRNIYTPIHITGDSTRELDFMILGGYNGSYHEHNLFEEFFLLEAISTVKLLSLANKQGMPIYDIDSSNIGTILPLLGVDASVKSAIQNSVAAGHVVKIHQDNLTVKNWTGCGYIDRDPTTNAAGY